jgi:hypothetical protein
MPIIAVGPPPVIHHGVEFSLEIETLPSGFCKQSNITLSCSRQVMHLRFQLLDPFVLLDTLFESFSVFTPHDGIRVNQLGVLLHELIFLADPSGK